MKLIKFIFLILLAQKIYCQECFVLNYGEGKFSKKFINELKKIRNPFCSSIKEIKITGDEIIDKGNISELKEGVLFCLTDNSVNLCKGLKNLNVIGAFISKETEYARYFKVLSFYPNLDRFFDFLNEKNLKKLIIVFSYDSSEKAMHIFSKAKEKNLQVEPVKIEKILDISLKISKIIENYDGIIIPIDKTYFDKELIKELVKTAHSNEKKLISFLDLFLDYGIDYSFEIEPSVLANEAIKLIEKKEKAGLFEVSEISFKERKGGKE